MSGITPLIDTLMHQVLGRQGESSLQRSINAPVQPVTYGDGPRALSRDAGLDGRPPAQPLIDELRRLPPSLDQRGRGAIDARGDAPPGSTQTHFSPAARSIADVLLRFPASPAALRPAAPLMQPGEPVSADTLSNRLSASIRDSGLFYEAHLKRWFQGDVPRLQLMREPQMQLARPQAAGQAPAMGAFTGPGAQPSASSAILPNTPLLFVQAPTAASGLSLLPAPPLATPARQGALTPGAMAPLPGAVQSGAPATTSEPGVYERPTTALSSTPAPLTGGARGNGVSPQDIEALRDIDTAATFKREIVHESLQPLVRQQLEMLATPALRWEGDVWAGIFMALVIKLPGSGQFGESGGEEGEADQRWHSQMHLDVPAVGAFDVALTLVQSTLGVDVTAQNAETHQRLTPAVEDLRTRLGALDFQHVRVTLKAMAGDA
ncbi:flagellar hook-length control protein FliK [Halomonas sp. PAMB 3264]|uniref:flagellar hook-length control protein FliK n=1 Tax=Halomonas sp. PAMB 3264 TaxID=3075222 RepID=UPI00289DDB06|nr:flagellar hook-length control protein FliK [Halomonas sp. PAMB 3264]WNL42181.1 flagellar hook-length control protein FliK [Halomonas sp. PAMB 3264]